MPKLPSKASLERRERRRLRREQVALEREARQLEREASFKRKAGRQVFGFKVRRDGPVIKYDFSNAVTIPFDAEVDDPEDLQAKMEMQELLARKVEDSRPS